MMPNDDRIILSRDDIRALVRETVEETLLSLGIDHENPLETQKDFQTLRDWRNAAREVRSRGLHVLVWVLLSGALGALWVGIRAAMKN